MQQPCHPRRTIGALAEQAPPSARHSMAMGRRPLRDNLHVVRTGPRSDHAERRSVLLISILSWFRADLRTMRALSVTGLSICLALAACEKASQVPTTPSGPETSFSPPYSFALSGVVFETTAQGLRPLPNADMEGWVESARSGYSIRVDRTDAAGRYSIPAVPADSLVFVTASSRSGLYQACAATARMTADAVLDVELVSTAAPRRTIQGSPTLSGVLFETTPQGKTPIAGGWVYYDWGCLDGAVASAPTDAQGRYELCRLPLPPLGRTCVTAGHQKRFKSVVFEFHGDKVLDIDLAGP